MDPSSITAAMAGVKHAMDLVTMIVRGEGALGKADLKLQLAEIVSQLADAKLALVEAGDEPRALQREIERLEAAFELRAVLVKGGDAYLTPPRPLPGLAAMATVSGAGRSSIAPCTSR